LVYEILLVLAELKRSANRLSTAVCKSSILEKQLISFLSCDVEPLGASPVGTLNTSADEKAVKGFISKVDFVLAVKNRLLRGSCAHLLSDTSIDVVLSSLSDLQHSAVNRREVVEVDFVHGWFLSIDLI
jgi:hypothetical protein